MKVAAVLGAGLQGSCVALALARRGFTVRLYDRRPRMMAGASANQEGKLHLGFVYAADSSLDTARAMIEGALGFAPAIEQLIGHELDWEPHLSARFRCVVHHDSTLSLDAHRRHFGALQKLYEELSEVPGTSYAGRRPERIWGDDPSLGDIDGRHAVAAFPTEECAVDSGFVRGLIAKTILHRSEITPCLGRRILGVEPKGQRLVVGGEMVGKTQETFHDEVDLVINCLWEGRQAIDRAFGLEDDGPWSTRIKYGFLLTGQLPNVHSTVITHGPFGDIVSFPHSDQVYISWYPACRVALSTGPLPRAWEEMIDGNHDPERIAAMLTESRANLEPFAPGLSRLPLERALAGTIVARGATDIDRPRSELHRRLGEAPRRRGNYLSLFTGKSTVAPLQALRLVAGLEIG